MMKRGMVEGWRDGVTLCNSVEIKCGKFCFVSQTVPLSLPVSLSMYLSFSDSLVFPNGSHMVAHSTNSSNL